MQLLQNRIGPIICNGQDILCLLFAVFLGREMSWQSIRFVEEQEKTIFQQSLEWLVNTSGSALRQSFSLTNPISAGRFIPTIGISLLLVVNE